MSTWSFYRLDTGRFTGRTVTLADDSRLPDITPPGCGAAPGTFDRLSEAWDANRATATPYQPPAPPDTLLATYAWDEARRRWLATPTLAARKLARAAPVQLLISQQEAAQPRALRDLVLALAAAQPVPPAARDRLAEIDAAIGPLRAKLQAIAAAGSAEQLDAIP